MVHEEAVKNGQKLDSRGAHLQVSLQVIEIARSRGVDMVGEPVKQVRILLPGGDEIVFAVERQEAFGVDTLGNLLVDVNRGVGDQERLVDTPGAGGRRRWLRRSPCCR